MHTVEYDCFECYKNRPLKDMLQEIGMYCFAGPEILCTNCGMNSCIRAYTHRVECGVGLPVVHKETGRRGVWLEVNDIDIISVLLEGNKVPTKHFARNFTGARQ